MNETIKITKSLEAHINEIYAIEKMCFTTPWSKNALYEDIIKNVMAYYVTALSVCTVTGYGGMWMVDDEAHITNIAVHKDYRHCGIGNEILYALIDKCRKTGIQTMSLEVRVGNIVAQRLYRKNGFEIEGLRKKYYSDNNEDAYVMWKYL